MHESVDRVVEQVLSPSEEQIVEEANKTPPNEVRQSHLGRGAKPGNDHSSLHSVSARRCLRQSLTSCLRAP